MTRLARILALTATLGLLLAACAEDPAIDDPITNDEVDEPDEAEPDEAEPEGAVVAVGSTDLGDVLVDDAGLTLYMFDPDEQGPSTCYDDCERNWPPLLTDGEPAAADGAEDGLLGTTERDDGSTQVTYDDWPLYYWAADNEPGDTHGQGVQDVWWVLEADGTPVRDGADDNAGGPGTDY